MAQHKDPNWRPGTGTLCPRIALSPEAETAYQAWVGIRAVRLDPTQASRLRRDVIDRIATEEYDTVLGRLMAIAVEDAEARPIPAPVDVTKPQDYMAEHRAAWDIIARLAELTEALVPYVPLVEQSADDRCRHGRLFSEPCADCGE